MIKIRQSIALKYSSCENGTLLIITFDNPPSNFTPLDHAERRGHVHILGAVLHARTCDCCVHTSKLLQKVNKRKDPQCFLIPGNQSNARTHTLRAL